MSTISTHNVMINICLQNDELPTENYFIRKIADDVDRKDVKKDFFF